MGLRRPVARDVCLDPDGHLSDGTQTGPCPFQGRPGDVEHRQAVEPTGGESVDERRVATARIEHACAGRHAGRFEDLERDHRQRLEPAARSMDELPSGERGEGCGGRRSGAGPGSGEAHVRHRQ